MCVQFCKSLLSDQNTMEDWSETEHIRWQIANYVFYWPVNACTDEALKVMRKVDTMTSTVCELGIDQEQPSQEPYWAISQRRTSASHSHTHTQVSLWHDSAMANPVMGRHSHDVGVTARSPWRCCHGNQRDNNTLTTKPRNKNLLLTALTRG